MISGNRIIHVDGDEKGGKRSKEAVLSIVNDRMDKVWAQEVTKEQNNNQHVLLLLGGNYRFIEKNLISVERVAIFRGV